MEQESHFQEAPSDTDKPASSALARGIQLLQAFTANAPALTARELMAATGVPKPTLFRLATTLCDAGLLRYAERSRRFMPAPGLAHLAAPLLERASIRPLAFGPMQALAERACGQVTLSLGLGQDLVFIELAQSKDCVAVRPAMGSHISLSRTASGRAYLAALPPCRLAALPPAQFQHCAAALHAKDPARGDSLAERMQGTRRDLAERGFCVNYGDLNQQIESVAVALRNPHAADSADEIYVFACVVPRFELRPASCSMT